MTHSFPTRRSSDLHRGLHVGAVDTDRAAADFVAVEHHVVAARRRVAELRHRSEEHTSELQSLMRISYAVFCLKKKKKNPTVSIITIRSIQNTRKHNTIQDRTITELTQLDI